jgi:hypothetical protein
MTPCSLADQAEMHCFNVQKSYGLNSTIRLHGVTTQKTRTSISTTVKTQNLYGCETWSLTLREDTQTENNEDIWVAEGDVKGD